MKYFVMTASIALALAGAVAHANEGSMVGGGDRGDDFGLLCQASKDGYVVSVSKANPTSRETRILISKLTPQEPTPFPMSETRQPKEIFRRNLETQKPMLRLFKNGVTAIEPTIGIQESHWERPDPAGSVTFFFSMDYALNPGSSQDGETIIDSQALISLKANDFVFEKLVLDCRFRTILGDHFEIRN